MLKETALKRNEHQEKATKQKKNNVGGYEVLPWDLEKESWNVRLGWAVLITLSIFTVTQAMDAMVTPDVNVPYWYLRQMAV